MKRLFAFIFAILVFVNSNSQIYIGYQNLDTKYVIHSEKDLPKLKNSTLIFVLPHQFLEYENEVEQIFKDVWTVSKYEIINFNNLNEYEQSDELHSFLTLDVLGYKNSQNPFMTFYDIYFNLWMYGNEKNIKKTNTTFGRIGLSQTEENLKICKELFKSDNLTNTYKTLYNKANFSNLTLGYFKTYISIMNKVLSKNKLTKYGNEGNAKEDEKQLIPLSKETLYIPDYIILKYTKSKKIKEEKLNANDLMEDYPFNWKISTNEEISDKIINNEKPIYYLVYSIDDIMRNYMIYNSLNSELIYFDFDTKGGYDAESKFFKSLGKKISKAIKKSVQ
jgi:hypothetical protein